MTATQLLSSHNWRTSYRHEDGNLIELFYNPALSCAVQYDRMTGYFSADALALASRGIDALIGNDGRMRLIVGCTLQPNEQQALGEGYDLRALVEAKLSSLPLEPPDDRARCGLQMLAWMVAQGHLDVKVAVPVDPSGRPAHAPGLYHEKVGVLTDAEGNRISFSGSINETAGGWVNNRESFHVHCSWFGGRESAHLEDEVDAFALLWDGRARSVRVFDFPDAARKKLLDFLPRDDRFVTPPQPRAAIYGTEQSHRLLAGEYRRIVWTFASRCAQLENGIRTGEMTSAITPWPHQIRTYTQFLAKWPWRLLIADEVGLGKTISAGLILRQALLSGAAKRALILTPRSVLIQWQNELYEKFNLNVPIYDGASLVWKEVHGMRQPIQRPVQRDAWQREPVVLCSSFLMRRADRQPELLGSEEWDFILLDEAHHARRRGAGTAQEKGPNALLSLMHGLNTKCRSLLLLTATPMQVHPVELWDLLDLLGLPPQWGADRDSFGHYFGLITGGNPSSDELEYLARMFRDTETNFGCLSEEDSAAILPGISSLSRRKVVNALRDSSAIPRKTLSADLRRAAAKLLQAATPLRYRMVRNTRGLMRRYAREGKLELPIAERVVKDVPVDMTAAETALYHEVEDYISDSYNSADIHSRSAIGFIMTVYRRRLASSFKALEKTLVKRLAKLPGVDDADASPDETRDEVMSSEQATTLAQEALALEERDRINGILKNIAKLGTDSKARRLKVELEQVLAQGYDSAIVFTQYTDTMEYLRDFLADQMPSLPVASYCGDGGAWRDGSGRWTPCSKEEIKRRLKSKQVRLLVGTDAAGEGLNLQFVGVLANYDLPWNPMKVEQRIGRIDRLGQKHSHVRVFNFAYKDTVEEDVFFAVGSRINLFQGIVGRLQPILSRLPKRLEELALVNRETRDAERQRFLADLDREVDDTQRSGFDIDAASSETLDIPELAGTPLCLEDLDQLLQLPRACPSQAEVRALDACSYAVTLPGGEPVRVTTGADTFDLSSDNHQLFSPGGEVFQEFVNTTPVDEAPAEQAEAVAWIVQNADASSMFVVRTNTGFEQVKTLAVLLHTLERVGSPARFPYTDWPGVTATVVA